MNEQTCGWLAGLLEGEGCFAFNRTPKISLSMTDQDIIQRVADMWGKPVYDVPPRKEGWKPVYRVEVFGQQARDIMLMLQPLMGARRSAKIDEVLKKSSERLGIAIGERAGAARLRDWQVAEILKTHVPGSYKKGESQSWLARKYGVSQAAVWYVINRHKGAAKLTKV
jgi:hypothetical protein